LCSMLKFENNIIRTEPVPGIDVQKNYLLILRNL